MIGIFSKNILTYGRTSAINAGKYRIASMSLLRDLPKRSFRISKTENLVIPNDIQKHEVAFKLEESIVNPVHELVKPGKEKLIGTWLLLTAAGVFGMIVLGGYTRLSKSGIFFLHRKLTQINPLINL